MPDLSTREQLAWAAGFYDGEGYCGLVKNGKARKSGRQFYGLNMQVAQADRNVLERLQSVLGGTVYGPYRQNRANRKDYWQWQIGTFELIQATVCKLWPWLSAPKKAQISTTFRKYYEYCALPKLAVGPAPKETK